MSLECAEVRGMLKELVYFIDSSALIHTDTPFLTRSTSSVTHKARSVDDLLGDVSAGLLNLLATSPDHVRVFGSVEGAPGSRLIKGNVPVLHGSVMELMDVLETVVSMIDNDDDNDDEGLSE